MNDVSTTISEAATVARLPSLRHTRLALGALLCGASMWGLTWWPMHALRDIGLGGVVLALLSTLAATMVVVPFAWPQRDRWRACLPALAAIFFFGGYANLSYTVAMVNGNPIRVMMLFYLAPVWALLGAQRFLGERIDALRVWAVVVAVCGAFLILGGPRALHSAPAPIDLLSISAGLAYAMNNLAYRYAGAVPVMSKNAAMFTGTVVLSLTVIPMLQSGSADIADIPWWWGLLFGLLWLFPAVGLTQFGVTHMEASRSAVLLTLELPVAALTAWLIGGARMTPMEIAGGMLILAAALLDSWPRR